VVRGYGARATELNLEEHDCMTAVTGDMYRPLVAMDGNRKFSVGNVFLSLSPCRKKLSISISRTLLWVSLFSCVCPVRNLSRGESILARKCNI
jgi:hypothetical protein